MNKYHIDILDNDLYKFTMQQAIFLLYQNLFVRYQFINRDNREFPDGFAKRLKEIIDSYRDLHLTKEGNDFLREKCYFLKPGYLDFLEGYRYNPSEVKIEQEGHKLSVSIEGPWYRTVLWEVPLMATISELYFEMLHLNIMSSKEREILNHTKAIDLSCIGAFYTDFGTRRRYSYDDHDQVVRDLKTYSQKHFLGTSNIYLAMKYDLMAAGTVAHEWYSAHAAMFGYKAANVTANESWVRVYQGDLGTALPDTFTSDVFLKSFNTMYAKLYDGVRQDSGNPIEFLNKFEAHYKKLRINPLFKMILFSDNLKSKEQILEIHRACEGRVIDRYGIGTWFTNDVGVKPLNMVIKLVACNFGREWEDTVKLSDDKGKNTGDSEEIKLCKQTLGIV